MKKVLLTLVAAFMAVTFSSSAFAAVSIADADLYAVVYDTTDGGVEMAINLGNASTFDYGTSRDLGVSFNINEFNGAEWSSLNVGMFAAGKDSVFDLTIFDTVDNSIFYMGKSQAGYPDSSTNPSIMTNFANNAAGIYGYHNAAPVSTGVNNANTSYNALMNQGTAGFYSGLNDSSAGEISLNANDSTDMYLYEYTRYVGGGQDIFTAPQDYLAKFTFTNDGTIGTISMEAAPAVVPVPGSVLLLISGLLSFVGLSRRRAA
ncbi:MAG: hypothetical protein HUN04_25760 [Desulfobacter sp.]|nr:MAG: hypothetical protein HUN04_25760 [Desulfobacter sp.]